jgi:hypothetical protein
VYQAEEHRKRSLFVLIAPHGAGNGNTRLEDNFVRHVWEQKSGRRSGRSELPICFALPRDSKGIS